MWRLGEAYVWGGCGASPQLCKKVVRKACDVRKAAAHLGLLHLEPHSHTISHTSSHTSFHTFSSAQLPAMSCACTRRSRSTVAAAQPCSSPPTSRPWPATSSPRCCTPTLTNVWVWVPLASLHSRPTPGLRSSGWTGRRSWITGGCSGVRHEAERKKERKRYALRCESGISCKLRGREVKVMMWGLRPVDW